MKRTVISLSLFLLLQALCGVVVGESLKGNTATILTVSLLTSQLLTLFIYWKLRYFSFPDLIKRVPCIPLLLAVTLSFFTLFLLDLTSSLISLPDYMEDHMKSLAGTFWGFVSMAILAPVVEEVLFRRIIMDSLNRRYGKEWLSVVVQAALFSLIHFNPAQSAVALFAGLLFGWLYSLTGSILPGIICHLVNNAFAAADLKYDLLDRYYGSEQLIPSDPKVIAAFALSLVMAASALMLLLKRYGGAGKSVQRSGFGD